MRRLWSQTALLTTLLVGTPVAVPGQQQVDRKRLAFEVASINQNTDVGATPSFVLQRGGVTITSYGLHQLIAIADDSNSMQKRDQIVGRPSRAKSDASCGWRGFGTGHYKVQGQTMEDLARGFASFWSIGWPVFDRTGLSGRWDVQLDYVPTFVQGPNSGSGPVPNPGADSGPDMLSALRDQLGLKLQSGKASIEYLVIDHVQRPTPD